MRKKPKLQPVYHTEFSSFDQCLFAMNKIEASANHYFLCEWPINQ